MIVEILEQVAARRRQQPAYEDQAEVERAQDALARLGPTTVYAFAHEVLWPRFDAYGWLGMRVQDGSVRQDSVSGRYSLQKKPSSAGDGDAGSVQRSH